MRGSFLEHGNESRGVEIHIRQRGEHTEKDKAAYFVLRRSEVAGAAGVSGDPFYCVD